MKQVPDKYKPPVICHEENHMSKWFKSIMGKNKKKKGNKGK